MLLAMQGCVGHSTLLSRRIPFLRLCSRDKDFRDAPRRSLPLALRPPAAAHSGQASPQIVLAAALPPAVSGYLPGPSNPTLHLDNGWKILTSCTGALQMAVHLGLPCPWAPRPGFGRPYLAGGPGTSSSPRRELQSRPLMRTASSPSLR